MQPLLKPTTIKKPKNCRDCKKELKDKELFSSRCHICFLKRLKETKKKKTKQASERKQKKKEKKHNTNAYLGKKAWTAFSKHLRQSQANFQGDVECYTCGRRICWTIAQAGHLFHRGRQAWKALDFDTDHIRLQDFSCNINGSGQGGKFALKLIAELGIEKVKEMEYRRHNEPPLTPDELKEIIKKYAI